MNSSTMRFSRRVGTLFVILGLSVISSAGAAESPREAAQTAMPMTGHLMTPFDTVPDFVEFPTIVSVKSGAWTDVTVWNPARLPGPTDIVVVRHQIVYDSMTGAVRTLGIDSGGKWSCATTQSTKLLVGTVLAKPGSTLECGTVAAPLAAQFNAEIVIRDLALETSGTGSGVYDPSQYGNGVLALDATVRMHGAPIATFIRLAAEPMAGSRTLTLEGVPTGWRVGDAVIVPDTRQLAPADYAPRPNGDYDNFRRKVSQSETATIQSISGTTVTLSTALVYNHKGARNPDGVLEILPHVGNTSRNITIRSENPLGSRGHVWFTGSTNLDLRYVAFDRLGRTTQEPLDSTTFDASGVVTHVGTNQIGRYALHLHHLPGVCASQAYQFTVMGVAITGSRKWAMTVHGSHYGLIQDNVVFDATGAGIVTEDGSETSNRFEHNFVVKVENSTTLVGTETGVLGTDPAGRKGDGFWFRGPNNAVRNNVVADTREGFGYYPGADEAGPTSAQINVALPLFPCADTMIAGQSVTKQLLRVYNQDVDGNEVYSTSQIGFGTWFMEMPSTGRNPIRNTTVWHAAQVALFHKYWNGTLDGVKILNEGGIGAGIQQFNNNSTGQAMYSELHHADIQGVDIIYQKIGQLALAPSWLFQDAVFRSRTGFLLNSLGQDNQSVGSPTTFTFRNVRFQPLPSLPLVAATLTEGTNDVNNYPKSFLVYGYQGDPADNFRIYYSSEAPTAPAPIQSVAGGGCPAAGLTNQQCWNSYGKATYQAVAACTATRPEINGFVCPIPAVNLPPTAPTPPTHVVVK